ncbi:MAG: YncE family protein [Burkholderiales bacterium]|nr:YncE family protein [Burkholderiales bacterium]
MTSKRAAARLPALLALAALAAAPLAAPAAAPAASAAPAAPAAPAVRYALKASYPIAGDGWWDYLAYDAASNRLFIAHATHVQVVDPTTGRVTGEIGDTPGVHGVALADDLGKGYTSNGQENTVSVFDLKTLQVKTKLKTTGENPDFIAYDRGSHRVFTFNGRSSNATIIDATTDRVVGTIALDGKPEAAAVDGRGRIYVNIENKSELTAIDTASGRVVATWPLKGCDDPSALAIDAAAHRLFAGCHNRQMVVVDADNGAVVSTLPIGQGVDADAYDAAAHLAFSSQGDGTLTVVRAEGGDRYRVVQDAPTRRGARTMALNPVSHDVYLVTADFEEAPAGAAHGRPAIKPGSFRLLVMAPTAR